MMLSDLLQKAGTDLAFTMLEVGALPIDSKNEPFHALLDRWPRSQIIAFEADPTLCATLNRKAPPGLHYHAAAVARTRGVREFFETMHPMCGSLYPPDERWADLFHNLDVMRLKQTGSLSTVPLDEFVAEQSIGPVDFIKMDIQGAELEALQGAVRTLQSVLAVVCEVEFVPLYAGQPLFGDVDAFLRSQGFVFHKFLGGAGRTVKPVVFNQDPNQLNQQMWADAIFIRDLFRLEDLSTEQLQKMALLLSLYGSPDVAHHLLSEHDRRTRTALGRQYLQALIHPTPSGNLPGGGARTTLEMADGVKVVLPDSLDLITTYVIEEQQDWFEDEIKFLRKVLQPGHTIVDIGANYGVYTLSMARTVGPDGCVWAFEPATRTAGFLSESIAANGFANVVLERSALSKEAGFARLSLHENSELNALTHDSSAAEASELVRLVTLDACADRRGWSSIDFVKIDAEGEEANILKGGHRFFTDLSPLVQYEVRASETMHLDLVKAFSALGYGSYRLVPGLQVLVPFEADGVHDDYLLNLFACKPDRAKHLAEQGHLVDDSLCPPDPGMEDVGRSSLGNSDAWLTALTNLPYGSAFQEAWQRRWADGFAPELTAALSQHALSRDPTVALARRFHALEDGFHRLKSLCDRDPSGLRLASLARVAQELGHRGIAVAALQQLLDRIVKANRLDTSEPFLAPAERFDHLPPGRVTDDWVMAGILEAFEQLGSYSSYYTGTSALRRLEKIRHLGYGSQEMGRRLSLVQRRFGLPQDTLPSPAERPSSSPFKPSVTLRETRGGLMLVPTGMDQDGACGEIDPEEHRLYAHFINTGAVVLEAGAGTGTRTVPLAQLAGAGGAVVAFEPQSSRLRVLEANLVINSIPNVATYLMALGAVTGDCQVLDQDPEGMDEAGEVVPMSRLDELQLDHVDFIRIATGGSELEVLEGAAETIARCRPTMYLSSDPAEHTSALIQHLFGKGYQLWWHAPRQGSSATPAIHMLAIHSERPAISGLRPILSASDRWN